MKFQRPIGAVRDVKELEYMVALHQSKHNNRNAFMDGSIDASDVKTFLRSRYGIEVTKEQVREFIFKGLAGGDDDEACIDIVEIVTIMIIPLLVKVANRMNGDEANTEGNFNEELELLEPPSTIIADVLKCILMDTSITKGSENGKDGEEKEDILKNAPTLTPNVLKAILLEYDEFDLLQDNDLVEKMVADATGGKEGAVLDVEAFTRALTQDVQLYNIENETRHTTIMTDIFPDGFEEGIAESGGGSEIKVTDEEVQVEKSKTSTEMKKRTTFSSIDFTADNTRSWVHVSLVWLLVVFTYIAYFHGAGRKLDPCSSDGFGCKVAKAIVTWVQIMLKLVIMGLVLGIGLSMGNGTQDNFILSPIIGIASVVVLVFLPAFISTNNFAFRTDLTEDNSNFPWIKFVLVAFGAVLVLFQIRNIIAMMPFSKKLREGKGILSDLMRGSNGKASYKSKQAGIYKVNEMVRNAYELHTKVQVQKAGGIDAEEAEEKKDSIFSKFTKATDTFTKAIGVGKAQEEEREEESSTKDKSNDKQNSANNMKDDWKAKNQSRKKDKSTKERALENFSNLMDETEEYGGFGWALKGFITGSLQQTEGIWLSSRLIAAVVIQFAAVMILFTVSVLAATDGIDLLYAKPPAVYDGCYANFTYDDCFFPWGEEFYAGIGICSGMRVSDLSRDGPCLPLFEDVPDFGNLRSQTCDTLDAVASTITAAVPFPGNQTCENVFDDHNQFLSNIVVNGSPLNHSAYAFCSNLVSNNGTTGTSKQLEDCKNLVEPYWEGLSSNIIEDNTTQFETELDVLFFCLEFYPAAKVESICEATGIELKKATKNIRVYEGSDDTCESVLGICAVDTYDPSYTATCLIGEINFVPYDFSDSCRRFPQINATLNYYDENVAPNLQLVAEIYPKKWQVRLTASVAIIVGTLVSLATALVYIPSSIHTILKFRFGNIPSLRDPKFLKYRTGLQNMAYLIGSMFWGLVVTTTTLTLVVAIVVFLLAWHVTRQYVTIFAAQIIGIVATLTFKIVFCMVFMKLAYSGYYRKRPASANVFTFALESWYLALTAAFVGTRVAKFLVATGLYIGRIDRPVLAEGLLLDLDSLPRVFRQNLLSTEAHRHPYIELLGLMYLMKLRHKDNFGSESGSAWRLIFVTALMPWLKKKRIEGSVEDMSDDKKYQLGLLIDEIFAAAATT